MTGFYADIDTDRMDQLHAERSHEKLEAYCNQVLGQSEAPSNRKYHAMSLLAQLCLERGDLQHCRAIIDAVLNNSESFWRVWYVLGAAQAAEQNFAEARSSFERCLMLHPRSDLALVGIAACLAHAGNRSEARACYEKALNYNCTSSAALQGIVFLSDPKEDAASLETVLTDYLVHKPLDTGARKFLAKIFRDTGRSEAAFAEAIKVLLVNPTDQDALQLKATMGRKS